MSKSMMGAAGGGKVTVEGLDADVVLAGSAVTIKQGHKVISEVLGEAFGNAIAMSRAWYGTTENRQYGFVAVSLSPKCPATVTFVAPANGVCKPGEMKTTANIDIGNLQVRIDGYTGLIKYAGGPITVGGAVPSGNPFNYVSGQIINLPNRYTNAILVF